MEEFIQPDISSESLWAKQEWSKEKITQADIARIEEQAKKAKQIRSKWQQIKRNNQAIAGFLSFLMKNINNDDIIIQMYKLFFTKENPNNWAKYLKSTLYAVVLIWIFVPFFLEDIKNMKLYPTYQIILQEAEQDLTLSKYVSYINRLCQKYKINFIENTKQFTKFLTTIVFHFWLVDEQSLNKDRKKELENSIKHELFR